MGVMRRICILHPGTSLRGFRHREERLSGSDLDLFVELVGVPEGLLNDHLEILYQYLERSTLAEGGTLTIVRGARVPIIKYIDSHGSGLLSLNIIP